MYELQNSVESIELIYIKLVIKIDYITRQYFIIVGAIYINRQALVSCNLRLILMLEVAPNCTNMRSVGHIISRYYKMLKYKLWPLVEVILSPN